MSDLQTLTIGAKHQVTLPKRLLDRLGLGRGSQLLVEVKDDRVVLHPAMSVPRYALPEELRQKFEDRRGEKPTDLSLDEFLQTLRSVAQPETAEAHSKAKTESGQLVPRPRAKKAAAGA